MAPKKPFVKKFAEIDGKKVTIDSQEQYDSIVAEHGTHVLIGKDQVPTMQYNEKNLPELVNVRNKKTGKTFTVCRHHFLTYQDELEIA